MKKLLQQIKSKLHGTRGQGTAEYAILVGVLVVGCLALIGTVGGQVSDLWNDITNGIAGL